LTLLFGQPKGTRTRRKNAIAEDRTHTAGPCRATIVETCTLDSRPDHQLCEGIGRGGMGILDRARDTSLVQMCPSSCCRAANRPPTASSVSGALAAPLCRRSSGGRGRRLASGAGPEHTPLFQPTSPKKLSGTVSSTYYRARKTRNEIRFSVTKPSIRLNTQNNPTQRRKTRRRFERQSVKWKKSELGKWQRGNGQEPERKLSEDDGIRTRNHRIDSPIISRCNVNSTKQITEDNDACCSAGRSDLRSEGGQSDPDLAALVAAWRKLPEPIRAAIRALVGAVA
jgi:hypothetical protein